VHFFELIYPPSYIDEELARLVPDLAKRPEAQQQQIRQRLRTTMWDHYKDCLYKEHHRRSPKKGKKREDMVFGRYRYMTMEAFQDPAAIAAELHQDFQSRWLTQERQDAIRGLGQQAAKSPEPATKEPARKEPERSGPEQQ
jgi:hypothetical protein